jgi:hypothetical protein
MVKKDSTKLHFETVSPLLKNILCEIMQKPIFDPFYLVGGTSLSLRLGHRKSADIDLFTNAPYGSLNFSVLEKFFQENYSYYYCTDRTDIIGFGRSYYVGNSADDNVKIDLFYHEGIINPCDTINGIRLAGPERCDRNESRCSFERRPKKGFLGFARAFEYLHYFRNARVTQATI